MHYRFISIRIESSKSIEIIIFNNVYGCIRAIVTRFQRHYTKGMVLIISGSGSDKRVQIIFICYLTQVTSISLTKGKERRLKYSSKTPTFYQNDLAMRNTADVANGKPTSYMCRRRE
jgi:hypothetical protein